MSIDPTPDEYDDRLIDHALREVVGGETPPDLSEQILFAATGEVSEQLSTRHPGAAEMATQHRQAIGKRNLWIGLTLAASLLIAGSIMLPGLDSARNAARQTKVKILAEPGEKNPADQSGRVNLNANTSMDDSLRIYPVDELPKLGKKPTDSKAQTDFDTMIDTIVSTVEQDGDENADGEPFPTNLSLLIKQSQQVVEESPVSGEWREQKPSDELAEQLLVKVRPVPGLVLPVDPSASNQPHSSPQPSAAPTSVDGQSSNRRRFGSWQHVDGEYGSEYGLDSRSAGGQTQSNWTREIRPATPTTKDPYAGQSQSANPPDAEAPPIVHPNQQELEELTRRRSKYAYSPQQNKPIPIEDLKAPSAWYDHWGIQSGKEPQQLATRQRQRDVSRELQEKVRRYQKLAAETGGQEASAATTVLNMHVDESQQLLSEIGRAKKELIELDVVNNVALQKARSQSALEQAITEGLEKDPNLAKYQAEKAALKEQIRSLAKNTERSNSARVVKLESTLATLQQETAKYRLNVELDLRKQIKAQPNDHLASVTTEYLLKKNRLKSRIAKLERDHADKIAEVRATGGRQGELSLLEAEIELLQGLQNGRGPDASGDKYTRIHENPFVKAEGEKAVSTFSIDVDTASYANVRQFLTQSGQLPPLDAVRIEELINYFDYDYTPPTGDTPFAAHVEVAGCPWQAEHRLVRVGIKGREIEVEKRPQSNLVFLIDVSGSMDEPAKLPLLVEGMKMLTRELGENDRVAIVVYASSEGLALPSTRGDKQDVILGALNNLRAGGSTAGGAGIQLAYKIAKENFIQGGINRVILATDGDFNVGVTSPGALSKMAETNAKETGVFLTVLGFGRGNLNDAMMEEISGKGNGNYHYVDNKTEAEKVLVAEMAGTLVTIAKDVKIQIEFNPAQVAAYRLIGYENRMLATEDFNDDKKDAGEIGAGHTVTAIYEIVPAGKSVATPAVDPLKYQTEPQKIRKGVDIDELLTLKLRYKQPDGDQSTKVEFPITDEGQSFAQASKDFQFAASVASFGMLLRNSEHKGNTSYSAVEEIATGATGEDKAGYRAEFLELVRQAKELAYE